MKKCRYKTTKLPEFEANIFHKIDPKCLCDFLLHFKPNAAGKKWQELFHQRFRTNTAVSFNGQNSITIRVFLGDYHLNFKRNGQIIHSRNITVDNTAQNITIIL